MVFCNRCAVVRKYGAVLFGAVFLAALFLGFFAPCGAADAAQDLVMKIGVAENVASGKLLGSGLALQDAKGTKLSVGNGATVTAAGGTVTVGNKRLALPVQVRAKSGLGWDKTRYRGSLTIVPGQKGITVVNAVDLESYVRGILKMEMNEAWPMEALKAQAILARTYAVKNRGRFAARGFDLCATQNSQVYRGVNAEHPRTDSAVAATQGQILAWNGAPADIFYHSDSGGATADIAHVWGGTRPYLQVRPERIAYTSPNSSWQLALSAAQVGRIMGKMGQDVGTVRGVEVCQKDSAGRAVMLRVRGDRGAAEVSAHAFRMAAGSSTVKSTNFTVAGAGAGTPGSTAAPVPTPAKAEAPMPSFGGGEDPLVEMTRADIFTKDELFDMLMNPGKREEYLKIGLQRMAGKAAPATPPTSTPPRPATPAPTTSYGSFVFRGKGWGHGVGMSQWGAKAMADAGMDCAAILEHYFPGTQIAK